MKTSLKALTCIDSLFSHKKFFNVLKCAIFTRKNVDFFVTCLLGQKVHSFDSLSLPENPFILFSIPAKKFIHHVHCFYQKVQSFYSLFLPANPFILFTVSARNNFHFLYFGGDKPPLNRKSSWTYRPRHIPTATYFPGRVHDTITSDTYTRHILI